MALPLEEFGLPTADGGGSGGGLFEAKVKETVSQTIGDMIREAAADVARGGLTAEEYRAENPLMELFEARIQALPDDVVIAENYTASKEAVIGAAREQAETIFNNHSDAFYGFINEAAGTIQAMDIVNDEVPDASAALRSVERSSAAADEFMSGFTSVYNDAFYEHRHLGETEARAKAQQAVIEKMGEDPELLKSVENGLDESNGAIQEANEKIAQMYQAMVVMGTVDAGIKDAIDTLNADISQIQGLQKQLIDALKSGDILKANIIRGQISKQVQATGEKIEDAELAASELAVDKAESYMKMHEAWLETRFGDQYSKEAIAATASLYRESPVLQKSLDDIARLLGPKAQEKAMEGDIATIQNGRQTSETIKEDKALTPEQKQAAAASVQKQLEMIEAHSPEIAARLKEIQKHYGYINPSQINELAELAARAKAIKGLESPEKQTEIQARIESVLGALIQNSKDQHTALKQERQASANDDVKALIDRHPDVRKLSPQELEEQASAIEARKAKGEAPSERDQAVLHARHESHFAAQIGARKSMVEQVQALRLQQEKSAEFKVGGVSYDLNKAFSNLYNSEGIAKNESLKGLLDIQHRAGAITPAEYHSYKALLDNPATAPQIAYLLKDAKDPATLDKALVNIKSISNEDYIKWANAEKAGTLQELEYLAFKAKHFSQEAVLEQAKLQSSKIERVLAELKEKETLPNIKQALVSSGGIITSDMYQAIVQLNNGVIKEAEVDERFKASSKEAQTVGVAYKSMVLSQLSTLLPQQDLAIVAKHLKEQHGIDLGALKVSDPAIQARLIAFDPRSIPYGNIYDVTQSKENVALYKLHRVFSGSAGFANAINSLGDQVKVTQAMGLETPIDQFFKIEMPRSRYNTDEEAGAVRAETINLRIDYLKSLGVIINPEQEKFTRNILEKFSDDKQLKKVLTDLAVGTPEQKKAALETMQTTVVSGSTDAFTAIYGDAHDRVGAAFNEAYSKEYVAANIPLHAANSSLENADSDDGLMVNPVKQADLAAKQAARAAANTALLTELALIDKQYPAVSDQMASKRDEAKQKLVQIAAKSGLGINYDTIHANDPDARKALEKGVADLTKAMEEKIAQIETKIAEEKTKNPEGDFRGRYKELETLIKEEIKEADGLSNEQKELAYQAVDAAKDKDGLDPAALKSNLQQVAATGVAPDKGKAGEPRGSNEAAVGGAEESAKSGTTLVRNVEQQLQNGVPPSPSAAAKATVAAAVLQEFVAKQGAEIDKIASLEMLKGVSPSQVASAIVSAAAVHAAHPQLQTASVLATALTTPAALQAVQERLTQLSAKEINGVATPAEQKTLVALETIAKLQQQLVAANTVAATIEHQHQVAMAAKTVNAPLTPDQIAQRTQETLKAIGADRAQFLGKEIANVAAALNPQASATATATTYSKEAAKPIVTEIAAEVKAAVEKQQAAAKEVAAKAAEKPAKIEPAPAKVEVAKAQPEVKPVVVAKAETAPVAPTATGATGDKTPSANNRPAPSVAAAPNPAEAPKAPPVAEKAKDFKAPVATAPSVVAGAGGGNRATQAGSGSVIATNPNIVVENRTVAAAPAPIVDKAGKPVATDRSSPAPAITPLNAGAVSREVATASADAPSRIPRERAASDTPVSSSPSKIGGTHSKVLPVVTIEGEGAGVNQAPSREPSRRFAANDTPLESTRPSRPARLPSDEVATANQTLRSTVPNEVTPPITRQAIAHGGAISPVAHTSSSEAYSGSVDLSNIKLVSLGANPEVQSAAAGAKNAGTCDGRPCTPEEVAAKNVADARSKQPKGREA